MAVVTKKEQRVKRQAIVLLFRKPFNKPLRKAPKPTGQMSDNCIHPEMYLPLQDPLLVRNLPGEGPEILLDTLQASAATTGHCDNCFNRHVTSDAVRWCPDCEEALCETCLQHHNASKLLKAHETVALVDKNKLPNFISELRTYCSEHNEKFEVYCMRHQECCCLSCLKEKHRECTDYETIKNVVKGVKTSPAFEDVEHTLGDVIKNFNAIIENRIANKARVSEQSNNKLREIKEFRKNVNRHLDKVEQHFVKKLSEEVNGINVNLDEVVGRVSEKKAKAEELKEQFENIKEFATESQAFLGIKILEEHLNDDLEFQNSVLKEPSGSEMNIQVDFSKFVSSFKEIIDTFGSIKATKSASAVQLVDRKKEHAQIMMPVSKSVDNIRLCKKSTISLPKKNKISQICGCTMLPTGNMAFCDVSNKCIIVCSAEGRTLNSVITKSCPYDITFFERNNVAVTLPDDRKVGIFNVVTGCEVSSFNTSTTCLGIDFQNESFFIRLPGKFIETDLKGNVLKNILCDCRAHLSVFEDSILSTIDEKSNVICFDKSGCQKWIANDPILKGPSLITTDKDGFSYVSGGKSNNVVVVSPDGREFKEVISESDLIRPSGIYFERKSKKLLVSEYTTGKAYIYDVSFG